MWVQLLFLIFSPLSQHNNLVTSSELPTSTGIFVNVTYLAILSFYLLVSNFMGPPPTFGYANIGRLDIILFSFLRIHLSLLLDQLYIYKYIKVCNVFNRYLLEDMYYLINQQLGMPNIAYVQILNLLISNSLIRACVFQIPTASNQFPILSSPNPYPHYYLQVSMQQTQQFKIYENNSINNFHTLLHQTVENKLFSLLSHSSICGKYYCFFKILLFTSFFRPLCYASC